MPDKFLLPVLIAAAVIVSGCTSSANVSTTTTAITTTTAAASITMTTAAETTTTFAITTTAAIATTTTTRSVEEFQMTASQWKFEPNAITVKQGDTVRLQIKSIDVTHGFNLPAFGVNEQLDAGKTATIEFVADKKGTFAFSCSVVCGAGHSGMAGKLVVE